MWVRTQDKDKLVNVNSFEIDKFVKDGNYIYDVSEKQFLNNDYYIYSSETGIIGIYKSRERALEVLDEIQTWIERYEANKNNLFSGHVVYKMPKE